MSMVGASAALALSDLPFAGPIGAVRVGRSLDGEFILNPTYDEIAEGDLDLVVAGTKEAITMVEAGANEVPESVMVEALQLAQDTVRAQAEAIEEWANEHGKEKQQVEEPEENAILSELRGQYLGRVKDGIVQTDRRARHDALEELREELVEGRAEEEVPLVDAALSALEKEAFRELYIQDRKRTDLRAMDEIRPTSAEAGILPRVHGSGLFTRGETQVLSSLALADLGLSQRLDTLEPQTGKRYMHHYNFPPYSTGETAFLRGPKRREIGHGALAERALFPVVPSEDEFPYALRIISEVLESNGSSSMASVCGSTLALMDGGVPIKAPVAGVAMGLVKEGDDYVILTDIQGLEDHMGDMDFKVAGTQDGITALQMDMKITGVSADLLKEALGQAREGRLQILETMREAIAEPRAEVSDYAPRVEVLKIPKDKIGMLIGPGGKTINALQEQFGVNISVEDDGTVFVAGEGVVSKEAASAINGMMKDVEAGEIYNGKVVKTTNFGAFVELTPGRDGLVHISRLGAGQAARRARRGCGQRGRSDKGAGAGDRQAEPHLPGEAGGLALSDSNIQLRQLPGGLRVFSEPLDEATSVALGVWIRAGSRDEKEKVAGISHLMEHMLFKGTPSMNALQVAEAFESIGAQENAATGEEYTVLYARFLPEHLERALDIMSDMILRPTLADLEREREVIVEEIKMYEDRPDQMADEYLSSLLFHDDTLGRPIIGSAETVRGVDHDTLKSFHESTYNSSNVFVVGTGKLETSSFERMVEEKLSGLPAGEAFVREADPKEPESRFFYKFKETEQYHVSLGSLGIPAKSEDRYSMAALNNVLGGGMSSRLFQEVREKRGLAYAVFSYHQGYSDAGAIKTYVGSTTGNVEEAVKVIAEQLKHVQEEPVSDEELERTKQQLKSSTLLAMESTAARMTRIGRGVITGAELLTPEEISERIEAVTPEDVTRLAKNHLNLDQIYLSAVGPKELDLGRYLSKN